MKTQIITIIFSSFSILCNCQSSDKYNIYGESFDEVGIINYKSEKKSLLEDSNNSVKLKGDIISTGTPAGVMLNKPNAVYLKDGDQIEMEIEGLGILNNTIKVIKSN